MLMGVCVIVRGIEKEREEYILFVMMVVCVVVEFSRECNSVIVPFCILCSIL